MCEQYNIYFHSSKNEDQDDNYLRRSPTTPRPPPELQDCSRGRTVPVVALRDSITDVRRRRDNSIYNNSIIVTRRRRRDAN
jgi:hypothetical protein